MLQLVALLFLQRVSKIAYHPDHTQRDQSVNRTRYLVPCQNCEDGDRWRRHPSSLRRISPNKFVLSPVWCSRPRPMTGMLLAPFHEEFRGLRSDYVRQVALKATQQQQVLL
ncbi:uncharacterized protein TNCV_4233841 [Trichonephila clavipes]|nr:uncharacterized protein TNCV_4233841 [Trichonephila clavipes]